MTWDREFKWLNPDDHPLPHHSLPPAFSHSPSFVFLLTLFLLFLLLIQKPGWWVNPLSLLKPAMENPRLSRHDFLPMPRQIYIYLQYVMSNPILMSNNLLYLSLYLYCIKILTPQSEAVRFSITLKIVVVCKLRMVEWCTKPKHSPDAGFLCRHFCHSNYTCNQHSGCVWYRVSTETAQTIWLSYLNIESKCNQLCH